MQICQLNRYVCIEYALCVYVCVCVCVRRHVLCVMPGRVVIPCCLSRILIISALSADFGGSPKNTVFFPQVMLLVAG